MEQGTTAPFERIGLERPRTPLVCAVPHAGRYYPPSLLADACVPRAVLEQLEDRHADRLVERAVSEGAVAIVARIARAWIDLNRAPEEVDQAMGGERGPGTMRVRSGLGLIPRRLGPRELLRRLPDAAEVRARIARVHAPYHRAVASALNAAARAHGFAVLIDCHTMPPLGGPDPARIVIGDRRGRAASPVITAAACAAASAGGLRVARNSPYAGAYTLDRHGAPTTETHALQVELDRACYLDASLRHAGAGLAEAARLVANVGWAAVDAARGAIPLAAE